MKNFCGQCGREIIEGDKFCRGCGFGPLIEDVFDEINEEEEAPSEETKEEVKTYELEEAGEFATDSSADRVCNRTGISVDISSPPMSTTSVFVLPSTVYVSNSLL